MDKLAIAVCEDSPEEAVALLEILEQKPIPLRISLFQNGEEFLNDYAFEKYDLILMDIYMEQLSGIEVIRHIRSLGDETAVAFITSSTEHALESYRLEAIRYIEKPVRTAPVHKLLRTVQLEREKRRLTLKVHGKEHTIALSQILYAEQQAHQLLLYLTNDLVIQLNYKLDALEAQLDHRNFFRCHKSYLVNFCHVACFDRELMIFSMKNGHNVHIRRASLSEARKAFENYHFELARR